MTLDEARLMAGVRERSLRLFASGYRAHWRKAGALEVASPQGARYQVDTRRETCDCPFFRGHEGRHPCKHLLGWENLIEEQRRARGRLALLALLTLRAWAALDDAAPPEPEEDRLEEDGLEEERMVDAVSPEDRLMEGGCRHAG